MSESALKKHLETSVTTAPAGASARAAGLLSLLGTDGRQNIRTIVSRTLDIFRADMAAYLPSDQKESPVTAGRHLSEEALSLLLSWSANTISMAEESGSVFLDGDSLPRGLASGCRFLAGIPVFRNETPCGVLLTGFDAPRDFGPDDHHAARCLAGALCLQHQLIAETQKITTGAIARQVAHDLNNLLAGLVSYPELVLMQLDDASALKGPISLMHDSGLQAAEMVQDFLILARPPEQQKFYRISPSASARAYCQTSAYGTLTRTFPKVRFSFFIDPDLPDISGTDEFIPKLFTTLLHHAAQNITGPGQIMVAFKEDRSEMGPEGGARKGVRLSITDNGAKTDEKDLVHLFVPFYTKKTMGRQGSGLGLAAVKKLIKDQGGTIRVSSGPDQGTRFDIFLPVLPGNR